MRTEEFILDFIICILVHALDYKLKVKLMILETYGPRVARACSVRYPPYTEKKLGWARWLLHVPVREGSFLGRMLFGRSAPAKQLPPAQPRADEKDIDKH